MAKVSPVSIKYMIHAAFTAAGPLEKPDVIGAIFGQTEGLLGEALEMRDLQKEGKIGRIEVDLEIVDGKSVGSLQVPSALDKSETTIIAAALETIDRIGPTEAQIVVNKIEDVRGSKRDFIIARAKKLLEGLDGSGGEIGEMSKTLKEENRVAKIQEYGEEKLPAGDLSGNEIIVCEGRADVVNLLKNRVNNVIGMNGTKLPAEIARLGMTKEITLFVDGDRGGKLIAQNVINNAKIAFVAVAPDGKEVEELQGKEILLALRRKITVKEYLALDRKFGRFSGHQDAESAPEPAARPEPTVEGKKAVRDAFEKIRDSKSAVLLDGNGSVIKQVGAREVGKAVAYSKQPIFAVAIDGQATSAVIKTCDEFGVQFCGATTFGSVEDTAVKLVSL
ncbi:DNA primase [Candidatus Pacearchaeota archaeon]|nr:DNA primase [Candidatus Pacearchaeota archaeon]